MSDLSISPTLKYPRNKPEIQNSSNTNTKEYVEIISMTKLILDLYFKYAKLFHEINTIFRYEMCIKK